MFNFLRCRNFHTDSYSCRVTQMQKLKRALLLIFTIPIWVPVFIYLTIVFSVLAIDLRDVEANLGEEEEE